MNDVTVADILALETAPAYGCTEPIAVALAAAAAARALPGGRAEGLKVVVDPNIFKNGMGVAIPGADGARGLCLAAAMGACAGDPSRRLEVLEGVAPDDLARAREMVEAGAVVVLMRAERGLYVRADAEAGGHAASAVIEGLHDNLVSVTLDGEEIAGGDDPAGGESKVGGEEARRWLAGRSFAELVELASSLTDRDRLWLEKAMAMNRALAEYGLENECGLMVGRTLFELGQEKMLARDMALHARVLVSAAADARLAGAPLPAMSCAGSGTQGLCAFLAVEAAGECLGVVERRRVLEAAALSVLTTSVVKGHMGRLSAMCGCAVASAAGAAAGISLLLGLDAEGVGHAVSNLAADLAGVICDGAKHGCALKLASAAGSAVQSALLAAKGVHVGAMDGIVGRSPEQTVRHLGILAREGMAATDRTILEIMSAKHGAGGQS